MEELVYKPLNFPWCIQCEIKYQR